MDRKKDRERRGSDQENEDMTKKHKGYHISRWVYSAKRYIYKPIRETERQTGKQTKTLSHTLIEEGGETCRDRDKVVDVERYRDKDSRRQTGIDKVIDVERYRDRDGKRQTDRHRQSCRCREISRQR